MHEITTTAYCLFYVCFMCIALILLYFTEFDSFAGILRHSG